MPLLELMDGIENYILNGHMSPLWTIYHYQYHQAVTWTAAPCAAVPLDDHLLPISLYSSL